MSREPSVPLRYRLPNPPRTFVGRQGEVAALTAAIERGAVTVLHGPPGVGKTALATAALEGRQGLVLYVAATETEELAFALLRVLAAATGVAEEVDWPGLGGDRDAAIEAALDLAEDAGALVVVDDLVRAHRGGTAASDAAVLLRELGRYARRSRWLFIDRAAPEPDERVAAVELSGLDERTLRELAACWARELPTTAHRAAAERALGSPARLREALFSELGAETDETDETLALVGALAHLRVPVPETLARLVVDPWPSEPALGRLYRQGWLRRGPAGLSLHDVLRHRPDPTVRGALTSALLEASRPDLVMEGLRLTLEAEAFPEAAAILGRVTDGLLARGYAAALFGLLVHHDAPELTYWRQQCASLMGNPTALAQVETPERDAEVWGRAQLAAGRLREVARRFTGSSNVEEQLLAARAWLSLGELRAADDALSNLDDGRAEALRALADARRGVLERDFLAIADRVRGQGLSAMVVHEALADLAEALRYAGRGAEALPLLTFVRDDPTLRVDRRASLLRAHLALDALDEPAAERELAMLRPSLRSASLQRPEIVLAIERWRVSFGDPHESLPSLCAALAEASSYGAGPCRDGLWALHAQVEQRLGPPAGETERLERAAGLEDASADDVEAEAGADRDVLSLRRIEQRARRGAPLGQASIDPSARRSPHATVVAEIVRSRVALTTHDAEAVGAAQRAITRALRIGRVDLEVEARVALADARLAAGHDLADAIGDALERLGSSRAVDLQVLRVSAAIATGDLAALERLAAGAARTDAVRRARWSLGEETVLDAVERAALAHLRARPRVVVRSAGPGWGIDRPRRLVWSAAGVLDFSRKRIGWRLLSTLFDHGGEADKETLVRSVWEESEYHPLRHDTRLQVAMRALREELELDPSQPERLLTTDQGYRLGGVAREVCG